MKIIDRICGIELAALVLLPLATTLLPGQTTQPVTTQPTTQPAYRWTLPVELRVTASRTYWPDSRIGQAMEHVAELGDAHLTEMPYTVRRMTGAYAFSDTSGGLRKLNDYIAAHRVPPGSLVIYLVATLPGSQTYALSWGIDEPGFVAASPYNEYALACLVLHMLQRRATDADRTWGPLPLPTDPRANLEALHRANVEPWPVDRWRCGWATGLRIRGVATTQGVNP